MGRERVRSDAPRKTVSEIFDEMFPYYLSIGMSAEEYWDGDTSLVRAYRKADEYRRKRENERLWLQGAYIYEALCCVAPIMHAFAKSGTKPTKYAEEPYPITLTDMREREEREKRKKIEDMRRNMMAYARTVNNKMKEGEKDG